MVLRQLSEANGPLGYAGGKDIIESLERFGVLVLTFDATGEVRSTSSAVVGTRSARRNAIGVQVLEIADEASDSLARAVARALTGVRSRAQVSVDGQSFDAELWPPTADQAGLLIMVPTRSQTAIAREMEPAPTAGDQCDVLAEVDRVLPDLKQRLGGLRELICWVQHDRLTAALPADLVRRGLGRLMALATAGLGDEGVARLSLHETAVGTDHPMHDTLPPGNYVGVILKLDRTSEIAPEVLEHIAGDCRAMTREGLGVAFVTPRGPSVAIHLFLPSTEQEGREPQRAGEPAA